MITYHEETDLFELPADGFCHGINCVGVVGGLAESVFKRFPDLRHLYDRMIDAGHIAGGDILPASYDYGDQKFTIYNLATQVQSGSDARLPLVWKTLMQMKTHAKENGIATINCPTIGCGIGGLDWSEVKDVMEQVFEDEPDVTLQVVTRSTFDSASVAGV